MLRIFNNLLGGPLDGTKEPKYYESTIVRVFEVAGHIPECL